VSFEVPKPALIAPEFQEGGWYGIPGGLFSGSVGAGINFHSFEFSAGRNVLNIGTTFMQEMHGEHSLDAAHPHGSGSKLIFDKGGVAFEGTGEHRSEIMLDGLGESDHINIRCLGGFVVKEGMLIVVGSDGGDSGFFGLTIGGCAA